MRCSQHRLSTKSRNRTKPPSSSHSRLATLGVMLSRPAASSAFAEDTDRGVHRGSEGSRVAWHQRCGVARRLAGQRPASITSSASRLGAVTVRTPRPAARAAPATVTSDEVRGRQRRRRPAAAAGKRPSLDQRSVSPSSSTSRLSAVTVRTSGPAARAAPAPVTSEGDWPWLGGSLSCIAVSRVAAASAPSAGTMLPPRRSWAAACCSVGAHVSRSRPARRPAAPCASQSPGARRSRRRSRRASRRARGGSRHSARTATRGSSRSW